MAEEDNNLTEDELNQIRDLLQPLDEDPHGPVFRPMKEIFEQDVEELKPPPSEDDDLFPQVTDTLPDELPPIDVGGDMPDVGGDMDFGAPIDVGSDIPGGDAPVDVDTDSTPAPGDDFNLDTFISEPDASEPDAGADASDDITPADTTADFGDADPLADTSTDGLDSGISDFPTDAGTDPGLGDFDSMDFGDTDTTPAADDPTDAGDTPITDFDFGDDTALAPDASADPFATDEPALDAGAPSELDFDNLTGDDTPVADTTDDPATDTAGGDGLDFDISDFAGDDTTPDVDSQDIAESPTDALDGFDTPDTPDAGGLDLDFGEPAADAGTGTPPGDDLDLDFSLGTDDAGAADTGGADDFDLDLGLGDTDADAGAPDDALPTADAVPTDDSLLGTDGDVGGDLLADDFDLDPAGLTSDVSAPTDAGGDGNDFSLDLEDLSTNTGSDDLSAGTDDFDLPGDDISLDTAPAADAGGGDFDLGGDSELDFSDFDGLEDAGSPTADVSAGPTDELGSLDAGGLDTGGLDSGGLDTSMDDLSADMLDAGDLADMADKAKLDTGIGDEFTDEQLASIRTNLNDYPPGIKKSVIDVIVNEKISQPEQRVLVNMVVDEAEPDQIADYLHERLGYRPDTSPPQTTKEGVPIIYAEGMSPEELASKRRRMKILALIALTAVIGTGFALGGIVWWGKQQIANQYERGLELLAAPGACANGRSEAKAKEAEMMFQKALDKTGKYDVEYLNRYGIAYLKAGCYEASFVKLFGKVSPPYGKDSTGRDHPLSAWNRSGRRAPLLRFTRGASWPAAKELPNGKGYVPEGRGAKFTARDRIQRRVEIAGAYIVERLRDGESDRTTFMNLARFHSYKARDFLESPAGEKFKNDGLAIDYYRLILTLLNRPNDIEAIAGIGNIYYDRKEFAAAARQFNRIIDKNPMEIAGHEGLLNTYIEMWKKKKDDPRWVIARHRLIQKLGLEKDLDIYVMTKLAGFYIELDRDDLRIKYQVDPVDQMSGLSIKDNTIRLLELIFRKEEKRDEIVITGSQYGEAFYQRGRYLMARKEAARALKQFQNAHQYDNHHYLAVNAMGEYYKEQLDFVKARRYFEEALRIYKRDYKNYGGRPEDEPLQEGDIGKIHYNLGSLVFLRNAGVTDPRSGGFPDTRIYPSRSLNVEAEKLRKRRELLGLAGKEFETALKTNVRDFRARIESIYWLGWIDYVNADFKSALRRWEELDALYDYTYSDPVLLMAKGNAYYYTRQYRAALGNFLKVQSEYERRALAIDAPSGENKEHQKLFLTLSAVYNNIGAVYEMEYIEQLANSGSQEALTRLEKNALLHYWKSIDAARKVQYDNEIPRTNQQLGFKSLTRVASNRTPREPLIDDWISPILPSLKRK